MTRAWTAMLALLLASSATLAHAQARVSLGTILGDLASTMGSQCRDWDDDAARRVEAQGRLPEAHSLRSAKASVCDCMPSRAKKLQDALTAKELSTPLTVLEFNAKYLPRIVNKCAADQMRATYDAGCAKRFADRLPNSAGYCTCMSGKVGALTEGEIAEIGRASSEYIPLAADAQQKGVPPPEPPAPIRRFDAFDASCRKR